MRRSLNCCIVALTALLWLLGNPLVGQISWSIEPNLQIGDTTQLHILMSERGDRLLGRIVLITPDSLQYRLQSSGDTLSFTPPEVRRIRIFASGLSANTPNGRYPVEDYYYSPSGFPLPRKRVYRNTSILFNELEFGIGQHGRIGVGYIVPVVLTSRVQLFGALSAKWRLFSTFNTALFLLGVNDNPVGSHVLGGISYGRQQTFASAGFGYFIDWSDRGAIYSGIQLGGSWLPSERWRVYSEAFIIFEDEQTTVVPLFVGSRFFPKSRLDFGLAVPLTLVGEGVPIPVLGFRTYF